jgi:hypothetical protein
MAESVERDSKLIDEVGETSWLGNCEHDDLPTSLPASVDGFDKHFRLMVQEKPSDFIDLIVERDSLLRINIHSSNSRNQIKGFLYESASSKEPVTWTKGSRSSSSILKILKA